MCSCSDKSIGFIHTTGALVAGTNVAVPNANTDGSIYRSMTVINDSDQDISVEYRDANGNASNFIVPKSIKGFTRSIRSVLDSTSLVVKSMHASAAAAGNITFNLGQ